jgi:hypothetical protein
MHASGEIRFGDEERSVWAGEHISNKGGGAIERGGECADVSN